MADRTLQNRPRSPEATQMACFQGFARAAAAEADAALMNGHLDPKIGIVGLAFAAEADAALMNGHS